ncbi:TetR/AcrR family transcriptional regulator [Reyranella aquatilis]|jgi:AcrR family transcriptional regulator|uniref:TetR/AcrR family transcriptional regulator n=1 Tax=Reyranella aquatilis TaxID=2035356 RepID=A0ABS8KZV7_9HYPH|nr:TetR/AcrR family transcriptional regulator [Reyranella aquatilis]MCC8431632.1 TetR/AcrR family transcriptional regulator [Reyranella aquatilis]
MPRQARATQTVASIVEAAAQILEKGGLAAFTTNAVAERAGVSIGTLYQYFGDKNALVMALARREMEAALADVARALQGEVDPSVEGRIRAMVRTIVHAFRGRQRARKAVIQAILSQDGGISLMAPVASFIARTGETVGRFPNSLLGPLTREQVFVVSRSLMGVVRAAVLEEQPFLASRDFEDEIVRLIVAYLDAIRADPDQRRTIA